MCVCARRRCTVKIEFYDVRKIIFYNLSHIILITLAHTHTSVELSTVKMEKFASLCGCVSDPLCTGTLTEDIRLPVAEGRSRVNKNGVNTINIIIKILTTYKIHNLYEYDHFAMCNNK